MHQDGLGTLQIQIALVLPAGNRHHETMRRISVVKRNGIGTDEARDYCRSVGNLNKNMISMDSLTASWIAEPVDMTEHLRVE